MRNYSLILTLILVFFAWKKEENTKHPSKYVWSLGYALSCTVTPFKDGLPRKYVTTPSPAYVYPEAYVKEVTEGSMIWVQSAQVPRFFEKVLPSIEHPFVLVVTDGDEPYQEQIQDPRILHTFAQNAAKSAKVTPIPIGIDFHTAARPKKSRLLGEKPQSVADQEKGLDRLLATLQPTSQRKKRALVDFHLNNTCKIAGESRLDVFKELLGTGLIDALPARIPRSELWQKKGQYAFSISPRGNGLDCHRTWEDLILGCIVIVKSSEIDSLYEGLPVVIVKEWSEITEANLDQWLKQYGDAFTNPSYREKLTHAYWFQKIKSVQSDIWNKTLPMP